MTKTHSTIVVIDEWDSSNGKHYRMIEDRTLNDPYKLQYQEEQCQGQYDWLNEDPTYFDAVLADRIQIINELRDYCKYLVEVIEEQIGDKEVLREAASSAKDALKILKVLQ